MFICSPQEKIIVECIKMTPFKGLHMLSSSYCVVTWMIHRCVFMFSESLVCPEQLNSLLFFRKILQVPQMIWFSSIFVYSNPFQQWLYDFEIHLFTPRTTEGLICNYYRRFKRSLMLQKEKPCIKSRGMKTFEQNEDVYICICIRFFLFCLNIIFFHLVLPFRSYRR